MELVLISVVVLGVAMALMAVGVIFSDRRLRGSCGGAAVLDADGEPISCGGNCGCVGEGDTSGDAGAAAQHGT